MNVLWLVAIVFVGLCAVSAWETYLNYRIGLQRGKGDNDDR
jgi:hypothetical protein